MEKGIKLVREEMKLSQGDFAELLGITRIHYNCIEKGRCEVTLKMLQKVAEISGKRLLVVFINRDGVPDF